MLVGCKQYCDACYAYLVYTYIMQILHKYLPKLYITAVTILIAQA